MNDSSIYIYNLTRNVSINHLKEIFMNFGTLKDVHYVTYVKQSMRNDNKEDDNDDEEENNDDEKVDNDDEEENNDDEEENNDDEEENNDDEKENNDDEKENNDDEKENNDDEKENNDDEKENNDDDNYICVHIKYENSKEAQTAKEFMDGGQIDGKIISVKYKINHKYIKTYKKKKKEKKKKN
ncbi:RNA-binding protein s1, putative [Plasmodium sp. gorilla clade G3]|nr:RNA-binding protein s1, putative [Plasmodium sp. gorilla clade G3]